MPKKDPTLVKMTRPSALSVFVYVVMRSIMDEHRTSRLHELCSVVEQTTTAFERGAPDPKIRVEVEKVVQQLCVDGLVQRVANGVYRVTRLTEPSEETEA